MPPLDVLLDVLIWAVAPSALVAAALLLLSIKLLGAKLAPYGSALGLAVGAGLGLWIRDAFTLVPGDTAWNRLPWAALVALGIGVNAHELPRIIAAVVYAAGSLAMAWWIIPPAVQANLVWLAPTFAALVLALWAVSVHAAARPPSGDVPFGLSLCALVGSFVLLYAGTARISEAATVLSAALSGIAVVAWWWKVDAGAAAAGAVFYVLGLLLIGQQETFSEAPWLAFILAGAAPLVWVFATPFACVKVAWFRLFRLALLAGPLAAALILARQAGPLEFQ